MKEQINRINQTLPTSRGYNMKKSILERWSQTVLRRMTDYRTRHCIVVKEAMTLLELALWKAKLYENQEEDYRKEPKTKRAKIDSGIIRKERRVTCVQIS
eukprot:scaffold12631_cov133-Skeletonema_marinoi.AAC.8